MCIRDRSKTNVSSSKKSAKVGKSGRKASTGPSVAPLPIRADKKSKPKPAKEVKKLKPITNAQKEEIAEKIGLLSADEIARAGNIIKNAFRKAGRHDLAVSDSRHFKYLDTLILNRIVPMMRWNMRLR